MQMTGEKKPGENSEAEITKGIKEMSAVLVCWRSSNWRSWNNSYWNKLHFCCMLFKKRWSIPHAATAAGFLCLKEATQSRTGHSVAPPQWYSFILELFGFANLSIVTVRWAALVSDSEWVGVHSPVYFKGRHLGWILRHKMTKSCFGSWSPNFHIFQT